MENPEPSLKNAFFVRDLIESFRFVKRKFWTYFLSMVISIILAIVVFIGIAVLISILVFSNIYALANGFQQFNQILFVIVGIAALTITFFLTFVAPLYGISAEIIEASESYAERTIYYLKKHFVDFFIASLIIAVGGFLLPAYIIGGIKSLLEIAGIYNAVSAHILFTSLFVLDIILIGGLSFMYPAIVARKPVREAFLESIDIMRHHFLRIYPSQMIMVMILIGLVQPFTLFGLAVANGLNPIIYAPIVSIYAFIFIILLIIMLSTYTILITRIYWIINSSDIPAARQPKGIQLIGE